MSEQSEQTREWMSGWPSALRVDSTVSLPIVRRLLVSFYDDIWLLARLWRLGNQFLLMVIGNVQSVFLRKLVPSDQYSLIAA